MFRKKVTKDVFRKSSKKKRIVAVSVLALSLVAFVVGASVNNTFYKKAKASDEMNQEYANTARDTNIDCDSYGNLQVKRNRVEDRTENMEDSWNVLVYMSGAFNKLHDEDFSKMFLDKIKNELNVSEEKMKNFNFIVEAGGTNKWQVDYLSKDKINRIKLNAQGSYDVVETLDYKDKCLGNPEELADFIEWGVTNYPAKHNMLLFWGTGMEDQSVCSDMYPGNADGLSILEIEYALAKAKKSLNAPFDIIMFDNGCTGTIDRANAIAPYANYMIASPVNDAIIKNCYDYVTMLNTMLNKPEASGKEICDVLFDGTNQNFFEKYGSGLSEEYTVADTLRYTVCDLTELDSFLVELNSIFKEVDRKASKGALELSVLNWIDSKSYRYFYDEFIDIGDYLTQLSKKTNINVSRAQQSLNKFVYRSIGGKLTVGKNVVGIALYHPFEKMYFDEYNEYRNLGYSPYFLKYLERTFYNINVSSIYNFNEYSWEKSPYFYEDNFDFLNYINKIDRLTAPDAADVINSNPEYAAAGFAKHWLYVMGE